MKLVTNRINTGQAKSFDDIVTKYMAAKNTVKTASVKTAEEDEGPSSGQLAVEPLHQKGDSTNQPKGSNKGDKTEADSSGQPEAEGKLTNDPKVDKDATEETEVKVAAKCEKCDCDPCECEKDCKKAEGEEEVKEAALEDLPEEVQDKIKGKKKNEEENEEEKEETKESKVAGKKEPGKRDGTGPFEGSAQKEKSDKGKRKEKGETCPKEAKSTQFVKIANLTDKEKSRLRIYYKQLWDSDFVDALLADK